ncbi:hypothetical protein ACFRAR_02495 [Kitasatospora sp. NPDC056651]
MPVALSTAGLSVSERAEVALRPGGAPPTGREPWSLRRSAAGIP